jgi:hypothetical protein
MGPKMMLAAKPQIQNKEDVSDEDSEFQPFDMASFGVTETPVIEEMYYRENSEVQIATDLLRR